MEIVAAIILGSCILYGCKQIANALQVLAKPQPRPRPPIPGPMPGAFVVAPASYKGPVKIGVLVHLDGSEKMVYFLNAKTPVRLYDGVYAFSGEVTPEMEVYRQEVLKPL